jgi:periplasmic protein TonB
VGNTLYGKTAEKATDPSQVKAYSAPKYMPIYQVDSPPSVASEVKIPYPEEARRAGIEGTVTLSITIDVEGKVTRARVLNGPGYGLNEAARVAILKFRFKPALKNGEAVSTEMKYAYTFLLD